MDDLPTTIPPAQGKLGVLLPGMALCSTTLIAGVELVKKGLGRPIGSLTQYGTLRVGKPTDTCRVPIKEYVPAGEPGRSGFGGWDIFPDNLLRGGLARWRHRPQRLEAVREELTALAP